MKTSSTVKTIVNAIIDHNGETDHRDIHDLIVDVTNELSNDFQVSFSGRDYRVIKNCDIHDIMKDELSADTYILGSFNSWFLSDVMKIPMDAIEKIQKSDCFDALGVLIANNENMLDDLVEKYISIDGSGHHFSSYDSSETDAGEYTVFCIG